MIETGLKTRLEGQVSSVGSRVYPIRLPQNVTYPALTYQCISDPRGTDHDGADGLATTRYQITPWAATYAEVKTAKDEVNTALNGFSGTLGSHTVAIIINEGGPDRYEDDADEDGIYSAPTDFRILYEE